MLSPMQQMIIAVLSSSAVTGAIIKVIEWLIGIHDRKKGKTSCMQKDIKELSENVKALTTQIEALTQDVSEIKDDNLAILHDSIYDMFDNLSERPSLSVKDRANLDVLWHRYHDVHGGNHEGELMYQQLKSKPVE